MNKILSFFVLLIFQISCFSFSFSPHASYHVCFTPYQNCTAAIVKTIQKARSSILVQAYSFTSAPIAWALIKAKERGVEVKVILDKSQKRLRYSPIQFLENKKIPLWIDYRVAIAHNKVMIIDNQIVITGSFNFTAAAQARNAENLLIIKDKELAKLYTKNWERREILSRDIIN